jgi:hypothetical protein
MDYLDEDQGRVFEDEDFAEEKFFAGAEAYAAAKAEQDQVGYQELTGQERVALSSMEQQQQPTPADVIHAPMPLAAAATRGMTRCGVDLRSVTSALRAADATCPDCRRQAGTA